MTTEAHITKAERNKPRTWVKLHTSYLDAPDLHRLKEGTRAKYFLLLMYAGVMDGDGSIYLSEGLLSVDLEDIAFRLRCEADDLAAAFKELHKAGLAEPAGNYWRLTRYCDEQPDIVKIRKDTAERMQKLRKGNSADEEQEREQDQTRQEVTRNTDEVTRHASETMTTAGNALPGSGYNNSGESASREEQAVEELTTAELEAFPEDAQRIYHDFKEYSQRCMKLGTLKIVDKCIRNGITYSELKPFTWNLAEPKVKDHDRYFLKCVADLVGKKGDNRITIDSDGGFYG